MKKLLLKIFGSKKFWYGIASMVVPIVAQKFGLDEAMVMNIFYAFVALILGQGIADVGHYMNKK